MAALRARREALELGLAKGDGGAALLEADLAGVLGPLAASLQVRPGAEPAVAAVLGPLAESIAVTSVDTAVDALELLRAKEAGQATLLVATPPASDPVGRRQPPALARRRVSVPAPAGAPGSRRAAPPPPVGSGVRLGVGGGWRSW